MAGYQLWLDESGDFKDEAAKKAQRMKGSLVGGLLIREDMAEEIPCRELIHRGRNHAAELYGSEKKSYVLPILERLKSRYGARQVFFENAEYEDASSNRQLYLRIMAEGLLQLMLKLNAVNEDVQLEVLIASRQDVEAPTSDRQIHEREYIHAVQNCIRQKKKERRLFLHPASSLSFYIGSACRTEKLQLADFVCNTRLTRDSGAFREAKGRLDELYKDAYIFSLSEVSSENYISLCLAQGMLSDALVELYTAQDSLDRKKALDLICHKMEKWSYRLIKSQLRQWARDIRGLIAQEDDYEIGERMLIQMERELIPRLLPFGENLAECQFVILLNLADMYLREGDILQAREALGKCEKVHSHMGRRLENLLSYYQLQEKTALYEIDSFQYEQAQERMERAVESFQNIMKGAAGDRNLSEHFHHMKSEYLGNALCMLLYAMMFRQRSHPEIYEKMRGCSELAMGQYPDNEGELERHRQYRSHMELEAGNLEDALCYLMQAKTYREYGTPSEKDMGEFLEAVAETEIRASCHYYLMYYIEIMEAAGRRKSPLAEGMHRALLSQERLYDIVRCPERDRDSQGDFPNKIDLGQVQGRATKIQYHPMEIVYWKYGSFLHGHSDGARQKEGRNYLRRAAELCARYPEYLTMRITGLGIGGELIQILSEDQKDREVQEKKRNLEKEMKGILALGLDAGTRAFVEALQEKYQAGDYLGMGAMIAY